MKIKKTVTALCTLTAALLCGCGSAPASLPLASPDISGNSGTFSKAQEITVIPAGTEQTDRIITGSGEIEAFIAETDPESWEMDRIPESAEETGTFQFAQEETRMPGQSENDVRMQTICEITVYDSPYLSLQLSGPFPLSFSFKLPPEAADYLNGYF